MMPFLTVVGRNLEHARNQAAEIMGNAPPLIANHRENVDYFQFNTEAPVNSGVEGFQAHVPDGTVCVLWVLY
jgi:hypothetical protein